MLNPTLRMIPNKITSDEYQSMRKLFTSRKWRILRTMLRNMATCKLINGNPVEACTLEDISNLDMEKFVTYVQEGMVFAPSIQGEREKTTVE